MKKTLALILSLIMVLTFAACGSKTDDTDKDSKPTSTAGSSSDLTSSTEQNEEPSTDEELDEEEESGEGEEVSSETTGAENNNNNNNNDNNNSNDNNNNNNNDNNNSNDNNNNNSNSNNNNNESNNDTPAPHTHSYKAQVTKKASCTATGIRTYTCSCSDSYDEVIPATGHSYTSKTTAATCTAAGKKVITCSACGDSKTETISKKAHSWSAWGISVIATPKETGKDSRTCSSCKTTEERVSAKVTPDGVNYFYNANNTYYQAGKVTVNARCVYWKDGKLYAQIFIVNGTNSSVKVTGIEDFKINNGSYDLTAALNFDTPDVTLQSKTNYVCSVSFGSNFVSHYGADLSTLNFYFKVV